MGSYSPHDLLPVDAPYTNNLPIRGYFYDKVITPLIKDMAKITDNGIPIDLSKVKELEEVVVEVLNNVYSTLNSNHLVVKYLEYKNKLLVGKKVEEVLNKQKSIDYFKVKELNLNNSVHITTLVNMYFKSIGREQEFVQPKWNKTEIKKLQNIMASTFLQSIIDGTVDLNGSIAMQTKEFLAVAKQTIYNTKRVETAEEVENKILVECFNPASSIQVREFFNLNGVHSNSTTKTGEESFDRDELTTILTLYKGDSNNSSIVEVLNCLIDHSSSAIIKNNFIKNFYMYTIKSVLYGNYNLFGTKTFRLTSNKPNLLQLPSSGSMYSKSLKRCLIAPKGYLVCAVDLSALEDRVIANLSKDVNKCAVFLDNIDGHTLNAYSYFKEEMVTVLPKLAIETNTQYVKRVFQEIESGNKILKAIRQKSKSVTFAFNYGAFPPKIAKALNIPIEEATELHRIYHQELYGGITLYRENTVLTNAKKYNQVHLGLGCILKVENAGKEERSIFNATVQFWSILSLLSVNKIHNLIEEYNYDIKVISTIYDSIYFLVREDAKDIQWLNNNIIRLLTVPYLKDQIVPNEAVCEIGLNWYDVIPIPNNASIEIIKDTVDKLYKENK